MILRRFMKHVTDQNWFAVGLDVCVVIVGIFLGMQVTEWNEARKIHETEGQYLRSLLEEVVAIEETALRQIEAERRFFVAGKHFIELTENPGDDIDTVELARLVFASSARSTIQLDTHIFDEMQNNGKLSALSSQSLRQDLLKGYTEFRRRQVVLRKNNDYFVDTAFISFLMDLGLSYQADPQMPTRAGASMPVSELAAIAFPDNDRILRDPVSLDLIRRRLSYRMMIASSNGQSTDVILKLARALKKSLERELQL